MGILQFVQQGRGKQPYISEMRLPINAGFPESVQSGWSISMECLVVSVEDILVFRCEKIPDRLQGLVVRPVDGLHVTIDDPL